MREKDENKPQYRRKGERTHRKIRKINETNGITAIMKEWKAGESATKKRKNKYPSTGKANL
jgi:hypothetical protein